MKHALCIGINDYPGMNSDLSGCVNDANDWSETLAAKGFQVRQLIDHQATRAAMAKEMYCIVSTAEEGDSVVITYSGHGSWVPDENGDEADARDEVLCPYDMGTAGPISDDEIYDIFAERQQGVHVALISDSCHSGSLTRLAPMAPEAESAGSRVRFLAPERFLGPSDLRIAETRTTRLPLGVPRPFGGVLLSGCQDTEYSYDAVFGGRPNGAFTYFALKALRGFAEWPSYREWHRAIVAYLPNPNHPQRPNLAGSRKQKAWRVFE